MVLLLLVSIFVLHAPVIKASSKEILVEIPFYLRARIHDSHSASVLFEIPEEKDHRTCEMYKFTIRRNEELPYSMPEQNLTYWRNSLELKHLPAGKYRICAIICSEHLRPAKYHYKNYVSKNRTIPVSACLDFQAYRSHLLVLTLYLLVLIFLLFSHTIYSLQKRQFQARVKVALIELESSLQKWRMSSSANISGEHLQSTTILQSMITLPISPVEHSVPAASAQSNPDGHHPILFHLGSSSD